jgi:hypothetical protein
MKCAKIMYNLPEYFAGETGEKENESIRNHIESCGKCSVQAHLIEKMGNAFSQIRKNPCDSELPPGFENAVFSRLRENTIKDRYFKLFDFSHPVERFATVALLLVVALLVSLLFSTFSEIIAFKKSENWETAYNLAYIKMKGIKKKSFYDFPADYYEFQRITAGDKVFHQVTKIRKKKANAMRADVEVAWREDGNNTMVKISHILVKKERRPAVTSVSIKKGFYRGLKKIRETLGRKGK